VFQQGVASSSLGVWHFIRPRSHSCIGLHCYSAFGGLHCLIRAFCSSSYYVYWIHLLIIPDLHHSCIQGLLLFMNNIRSEVFWIVYHIVDLAYG
jgi:hypothetical protein